jgi:hypothetical protein
LRATSKSSKKVQNLQVLAVRWDVADMTMISRMTVMVAVVVVVIVMTAVIVMIVRNVTITVRTKHR